MRLRSALTPIKEELKRRPTAHRIAKNVHSALFQRRLDNYLRRLARAERNVFFLQIGAHDGKTDDPLHGLIRKHHWNGVLIEPVAYLFNRLVRNYSGVSGLAFENKALADSDGRRMFYHIRQSEDLCPVWYDQLGSFYKEVILRHSGGLPNIEDYIEAELVECICFRTLVESYSISRIDLILIDTEGYDLQILKQIDFSRFAPRLVIYEEKHLSVEDKQMAKALLTERGYAVFNVGPNNVATFIKGA
jgi:FkbM family methyltransferase